MSDFEFSPELLTKLLNEVLDRIKSLTQALDFLLAAESSNQRIAAMICFDAIGYRSQELSQTISNLESNLDLEYQSFPLTEIIAELNSPAPTATSLRQILEPALEPLRKAVLSQILRLAIH